jgi:periplasmic copper chaperone A
MSGSRLIRTRLAHLTFLVCAAALGFVVLMSGQASAHVAVSPDTVPEGSSTELTFRVPNEESSTYTSKIAIQIPTVHPIAQVLAKPVPGWTVTTRTVRLAKPLVTDDGTFTSAVSEIIWSGGRIAPGEYQDFALSADPLPDTPTELVFKTLQTYSNGEVVRWIDVQQAGQDEPEHPAPVLSVTGSTSNTGQMAMPAATRDGTSTKTWPGLVAALSLALAVVAVVLSGWALRRIQRSA